MNRFFYLAVLSAAFFSSCEEGEKKEKISQLSITANVDQVTRASKSSFVAGDEIGVFLFNSAGNSYNSSSGCINNKATLSSSTWTMEKEVTLTDDIGTAYAYSPYSSQVTDIKQVPVSSSSQTDFLYAISEIVDATNPVAALRMKHAFSLVKFTIKKDGYTGEGHITEVALKNIGLSGTMDAMTGDVTTLTTGNEKYEGIFYLDESSPLTIGIIAFPQSVSGTTATIVIDGVSYGYKLAPSNWEVGKETTNTLKINQATQSLITIGSATIDNWGTGGNYEGNFLVHDKINKQLIIK